MSANELKKISNMKPEDLQNEKEIHHSDLRGAIPKLKALNSRQEENVLEKEDVEQILSFVPMDRIKKHIFKIIRKKRR